MGSSQSYLEPAWSLDDMQASRQLPTDLREKLGGLDYRVRKNLGRYSQDRDDMRNDDDASSCSEDVENGLSVAYHTQDVPESLDRLRVVSAKFTIDLNHLGRASSIHSLILQPPAVELPETSKRIPAINVCFCFSVTAVAPTHRQNRKVAVGTRGINSLGVKLRMQISRCGTGPEFSDTHDLFGKDSNDQDMDEGFQEFDEVWHAPTMVGFATSPAFVGNIDAEIEDGKASRWWNEKESLRQQASVPLSKELLHPGGPFAKHVCGGGAVLDLRRCQAKKLDITALWKAAGCSYRSAQSLWALFSHRSLSTKIVTPFRRTRVLHSLTTALERVSMCPDLVVIIAAFTLEPAQYTFEADIYFGIGLCNF